MSRLAGDLHLQVVHVSRSVLVLLNFLFHHFLEITGTTVIGGAHRIQKWVHLHGMRLLLVLMLHRVHVVNRLFFSELDCECDCV
jgi:hypothetical protein